MRSVCNTLAFLLVRCTKVYFNTIAKCYRLTVGYLNFLFFQRLCCRLLKKVIIKKANFHFIFRTAGGMWFTNIPSFDTLNINICQLYSTLSYICVLNCRFYQYSGKSIKLLFEESMGTVAFLSPWPCMNISSYGESASGCIFTSTLLFGCWCDVHFSSNCDTFMFNWMSCWWLGRQDLFIQCNWRKESDQDDILGVGFDWADILEYCKNVLKPSSCGFWI